MLISTGLFQKAYENYHKESVKRKKKLNEAFNKGIENFNLFQTSGAGFSYGISLGMFALAVVFLAMEFLVLFYNITIVLRCTKPGGERVVHFVLAVMFTLPYALFNAYFSKCGVNVLQHGGNVVEYGSKTM